MPWHRAAVLLALVAAPVAQAQPYAYVASSVSSAGDLAIVDLATDSVSTIPIGAGSLGVAAGATRVYVSSWATGEVVVLDAASRAVVTRIQVGGLLGELALSKDGSRLYVITNCANPCQGPSRRITAIDAATDSILRSVSLPAGVAIALSPDASTLYLGDTVGKQVFELDASSLATLRTIPVPAGGPFFLAPHPDGSRVYASGSTGTISVISVPQHQVIRTIQVPGVYFRGIAIHPTAPRAYVADRSARISVIDTTNDTVLKSVGGIGPEPYAVSMTPDGSRVYVVDPCIGSACPGGVVYVFDTAVEQVTKFISPVASHPHFLGQFVGGGGAPKQVAGLRCPPDLCRLFPRPHLHFCEANPHECIVHLPPLPWCRGIGCGISELERFDPSREGIFVGRVEGARVERADGIQITREPRLPFETLEAGSVLREGSVLRIPPGGRLEIETPAGVVRTPREGLPPRGDGGSWLFYVVGRSVERPRPE